MGSSKEMFLNQRAKIYWFKEYNANTHHFHVKAWKNLEGNIHLIMVLMIMLQRPKHHLSALQRTFQKHILPNACNCIKPIQEDSISAMEFIRMILLLNIIFKMLSTGWVG